MPKFFIIGTPIGNLGDITLRGLETLKLCDALLCEDTRNTSILLNHFNITGKKLIRFDKFVENSDIERLMRKLTEYENIGMVSDAGMPGISDPGALLVSYLMENNINYEVIPGVSSLTTAIAGFGLKSEEFYFGSFLPRKKKELSGLFERLSRFRVPSIFFESPNRLEDTLNLLGEHYPEIEVYVGRELTKIHEQFVGGKPLAVMEILRSNAQLRGEIVLLIDFSTVKEEKAGIPDEKGLMNEYDDSLSIRENSKILAKKYGLSSSDVYKILIKRRD